MTVRKSKAELAAINAENKKYWGPLADLGRALATVQSRMMRAHKVPAGVEAVRHHLETFVAAAETQLHRIRAELGVETQLQGLKVFSAAISDAFHVARRGVPLASGQVRSTESNEPTAPLEDGLRTARKRLKKFGSAVSDASPETTSPPRRRRPAKRGK